MKAFVILVIIALGGWYAWHKGWIGGDAAEAEATTAEAEAEAGAGFDGVAGGAAAGDGGAAATGDGMSEEMKQLLAACETRWSELEGGEKPPGLAKDAPKLALDYSTVLKATYNQPGLKQVQERIVTERLAPLAEKLFFSKYPYREDETGIFALHQAEKGEDPEGISKRYGMSYQLLNLMREHPPESAALKLGESLKVINAKTQGGYLVHVDKGDFFADVYICGILARRYPVGIGAIETPTPLGKAHIDMRSLEPDWTDPNSGEVYAWNDPRNLLGRVWLRLKSDEIGQGGIGIHGFNGDPALAVKVKASNGCVRMRNEDAEELYNIMVPVGYYPTEGFLQRAPMLVEIVE
jgi:hypothetical protein